MKWQLSFLTSILAFSSACTGHTEPKNALEPRPLTEVQDTSAPTLADIGMGMLGRPYISGVLNENGATEALVLDTVRLDCWTFVEYSLAKLMANHSSDFAGQVRNLRYRHGVIDGYGSRLHYFTEWALQAEHNGFVHDITKELGGDKLAKKVKFISNHLSSYPLCAFGRIRDTIAASEQRISAATRYYIPKMQVAAIEAQLVTGDIVGITATAPDLDFVHQGIIVRKNGDAYLLHASSDFGNVVFSEEPLSRYLAKHKKQSGIIVLRVQ